MTTMSFPAAAARKSRTLVGLLGRIPELPISRRLASVGAVALALLVTTGDMLTGATAVFTIFYLVPIAVASWFRTKRAGVLTALLCTVGSVTTDLHAQSHSSVLFLIWDDGGEFLMFLGFVWLLATLKIHLEHEQQLRKASIDQLRHAERLNTLGKLASGVAHELGTPLNVISGRAELIEGGGVNAKESARVIFQQAERMTLIIRQLLDFARTSGTDKATLPLRQLCEETVALLSPLARKAGVELLVSGENVETPLNRAEIQQVLSNLITNAVHAMKTGGEIQIIVSRENIPSAGADGHQPGNYAVISVHDEGTGIPLAVLPKIFDPFFTTKDVGEGTGLGLSVSHGIVRDHGGWVRVKSELGVGTTFFVHLPLQHA